MKKWRTYSDPALVRRRWLPPVSATAPPSTFDDTVVTHAFLFSKFSDGSQMYAAKKRAQRGSVLWPSTFLNPGELVDRCWRPEREWGDENSGATTSWTKEGDC
jgi:hypothetical protein